MSNTHLNCVARVHNTLYIYTESLWDSSSSSSHGHGQSLFSHSRRSSLAAHCNERMAARPLLGCRHRSPYAYVRTCVLHIILIKKRNVRTPPTTPRRQHAHVFDDVGGDNERDVMMLGHTVRNVCACRAREPGVRKNAHARLFAYARCPMRAWVHYAVKCAALDNT